jgi:hypothetical protein
MRMAKRERCQEGHRLENAGFLFPEEKAWQNIFRDRSVEIIDLDNFNLQFNLTIGHGEGQRRASICLSSIPEEEN